MQNKGEIVMIKVETGDLELRKAFAQTLEALMDQDKNVVYLEADLGGAIGTSKLFQSKPEQAFDIGIMEANMVGVAAGMSIKGKIPFVHSFGTFSSRRCADQTFISGCYNHANVKIIGSDPGVSAQTNGGTHMPLEDVGVYRSFPGMTILDVADPHLLKAVLKQAAADYGMYYIRFPRKFKACYYSQDEQFTVGQGKVLREGGDVTLVASGIEVYEALKAAELLAQENISAEVIDMFTIKPLDEKLLVESAAKTGRVVTAENHNRIGGLGSAVTEVLAEQCAVPVKRIGVDDHFGEVGDLKFLMQKFHLTAQDIAQAARELVNR